MPKRSIQRYVGLAIVLAMSVGMLAASGRLAKDRITRKVRDRAEVSAQLNAALVRNNLERYRALPFVLAQDIDVREALSTRSPEAITRLDQKLESMADRVEASAIFVLDRQGNVVAASNWRKPATFVGMNYRFRPYYRDAMIAGHNEHFALGTVSHLPGLYVSHRVDRLDTLAAVSADASTIVEARAPGEPESLGVVVVKVEFQRLEADWRHQPAPVFITDDHGVVLLSSEPELRFRALAPLPESTQRSLRTSLQFGDAKFAPLALKGDSDALVHLPIKRESSDRYLHVHTPVQSVNGWHLHVLPPAGQTIKRSTHTAQITTLLAVMLIVGGTMVWWQRDRRRMRRELERAQMLERLKSQVDKRTHELAHEIEEHERAEHHAHHLQSELDQASKLSVLGQITAGVAHEINQPVTAIRNYAENTTLLIAQNRYDEAASNMQAIAGLTERIGHITAELRQFARRRVDDNRGRRADIGAAIDSAVLLLSERQRREGITLRIDMVKTLTAAIEPLSLEQILINVLTNAMDALNGIAQPSIRLTVRLRPAYKHVKGHTSPRLEIVIRDNGPGMDAVRQAALFTPFSTGKPDGLGLGLGLVISRELAREAGGDLEAPPSDGDGAVFVLTLPIV